MLTEKEAAGKWCPFARVLGTLIQPAHPGGLDHVVATGGQNRGYQMGGALHNCMCIASQCMAWRSEVVSLSHTDRDGEHPEVALGYCGAFSHPLPSRDRA